MPFNMNQGDTQFGYAGVQKCRRFPVVCTLGPEEMLDKQAEQTEAHCSP